MKVIVVGSSHGGYEAILELLQDYPQAEIQWYEKGNFISFLSCGMQLYLEGVVKDVNTLRYATPTSMEKQGIHVFVQQDVTAVDPDQHEVQIHNLADDTTRTEKYDKLILSTGAVPAALNVPGKDLDNIYFMRGRDWAIKLKKATVDPAIQQVVIVGSGYIGMEAAEVFAKAGKQVTVLDIMPRILNTYLDQEFTGVLDRTLAQHQIKLGLGETVQKFVGNDHNQVQKVVTDEKTYLADLVIEATGVKPNTNWLANTLELNADHTIKIDAYQRTSAPDVFAVGDATHVQFAPTEKEVPIALATNSRRQGRYAVKNLTNANQPTPAVSGSSALSVFEYHFAATGVKEATAAKFQAKIASVYVEDTYRPHFVPESQNATVQFKLSYNPDNGQIMGAQIMSRADVTAEINVISLAIQQHLTVNDLAYADFFFQPGYDRPWNIINVAAQKAQAQLK